MAAQDYTGVVQQLYVSYFGRPADYFGLQNFTKQLDALGAPKTFAEMSAAVQSAPNGALAQLVGSFANSPESVALYGNDNSQLGISKFVTAIYKNFLGREPDLEGYNFWTNAIVSGGLNKANAAAAITQGALANTTAQGLKDAKVVANKLAVATSFTDALDLPSEFNAYAGDAAAATARALLQGVNDTTSVTGYQTNINAAVDAIVGNVAVGTTYTLGIGEDKLVGTSGNDTFNALVVQDNAAAAKNSLESIDQLDGGAGIDTLNATISGAGAAPVLKNIENVNVRFASANALDLTNSTGVMQVTIGDSSAIGTVAGVGAIATLAVKNQKQDAVFTGNTATTLNLNLDTVGTKGGTANTVTLADVATTLNVAANNAYVTTVGTLATKTLSVAATGANVLTLPTVAETLTVTGTGSVELATAFTTLKTLNASANAGGVTATVDAKAVTVTGGAGADKITYSAAVAANAKVDLGAGNDVLTLTAASVKGAVISGGEGVDTLAVSEGVQLDANAKAIYTGFEVLQVSNVGAAGSTEVFDPTLVNGITAYKVAASTGAVGLINLAAAPAVTVTGNVTGTDGVKLTLKDATGTSDAATVTLDNGSTTASTGLTVSKLTALGVETINLNSSGLLTANAKNVVTNDVLNVNLSKVVISGSQALEFVTGATTVAMTVDASAATGKVTVTGSAATELLNINGGSGSDVITAGTKGGLIYGGAGGDTITLGGDVDTLVYKAATESQLASKADGTLDVTKLDAVTGFATGADRIDLTSLGFTLNTQKVVLEKTVAAGDAALWALATSATFFSDAAGIARGVVAVSNGAETYIFADANKDGVFTAADDLVIKLTGVATGAGIDQADVIFG